MKRTVILILISVLTLGLTACGQAEEPAPGAELPLVYEAMADKLPEMIMLDADMLSERCGIAAEDCAQSVAAISYDGLRADEIWLVEAVSKEALDRIEALAQTRLKLKGEETVDYAPEQYEVVQKAELIREGMYLAFLVTPEAASLAQTFRDMIG